MKLHELRATFHDPTVEAVDGVCCGEVEDEVDGTFDDDDFYEACDLLETCRKAIDQVMKHTAVSPGRRHLLVNLCDDIKQFVDGFIVNSPEGEDDKP